MDFCSWIAELHGSLMASGDPRTNKWPLVPSPLPSLYFIAVYVTIAVAGPVVFKLKKPLPIQPLMVAFNITIVIISCYLCEEFFMCAYLANYSLTCEPLDVSDHPLSVRMASAFWIFYVMRFATALDTVFLILRKKSHQVSVRHVFHHASTPIASWIAVKYAPGGQSFMHGLLTAVVHVIIYSYIAALCYQSTKQFVMPFKRFIPVVHVTQLSIITCHSLLGTYQGCFVPNWPLVAVAGYCSVLILNHIILGETVLVLDLVDTYWPRWLYGSLKITQMKKQYRIKA